MGRWSRPVATRFVAWLGVPAGRAWLDVGCGTGALTAAVLAGARPSSIVGVDPSEAFLRHAAAHADDARAAFRPGRASLLPAGDGAFDAVVCGLALNFAPSAREALAEMARVTAPGGVTAAYVWDYAGGMELLRRFWDAAVARDPSAGALDEGARFPLCRPDPLRRVFADAGLTEVEVDVIRVPTVFAGFEDLWAPFLGGQGPAPAYVASLGGAARAALRESVRSRLPVAADGSIRLRAAAWAVRGTRPARPRPRSA
ncbi:class I SAM-dependent methyltransferase [Miltoncostaea marina]|uniref:class I SAM-dependent methyltransferase n=1 Tax=Miltoncostaea marina TaxID=2843215 RepID=UPI0031BB17AB